MHLMDAPCYNYNTQEQPESLLKVSAFFVCVFGNLIKHKTKYKPYKQDVLASRISITIIACTTWSVEKEFIAHHSLRNELHYFTNYSTSNEMHYITC